MNKIISHIKWFLAVFPVGLIALVTSPIIFPLAWVLRGKYNPLWIWLDDEIFDSKTNKDWIVYCGGDVTNFWYLYRWHAFRNSMWNLKELIKPENARKNCEWNKEEIVEIIKDNLWLRGTKLDISSPCLGMAAYRWIDKNGNEGWQVNRGEKISYNYSITGSQIYWYKAQGKLYYRHSVAKEFSIFGIKFAYEFRMGASEKRYLFILKLHKL